MTARFNLVDEPWIPYLGLDGQRRMCGIEEALVSAHEFRGLFDQSPLATVALHRLLLAILHQVLSGPKDAAAWANLWDGGSGRFPEQQIRAYLQQRRDRFDLFSVQHPFYQSAALPFTYRDGKGKEGTYCVPVAKLALELACGNNETLFDHRNDDSPQEFEPAYSARLLVAYQAFAVGGLVTSEKGQNRSLYGSADMAPMTKGAATLVRGDTLFQTLMLNLHQYNADDEEPFPFDPAKDIPAWDRLEGPQRIDRAPNGYVDLLTWQSRLIRLKPETDAQGRTVVRHCVVMKGEQFPKGFLRVDKETMLAFVARTAAAKGTDPWIPVAFMEDRALWRDSLALVQSVEHRRARPKILRWLHELCQEGVLPRSAVFQLDLLGMSSDRAKVNLWRHERRPLPLAYLDDPELVACLERALTVAEDGAEILRESCWSFARLAIVPDENKVPSKQQKKSEISPLADSLAGERRYWPRLELPFLHLLEDLPGDVDERPDAKSAHRAQHLTGWTDTVRRTAWKSFRETVSGFDRTARLLKAAVRAEGRFMRELNKRPPKTEDANEPTKSA